MASKKASKSVSSARSASPLAVQPVAMKPIGILGGGQLARMMILEAQRLGIPVTVMSENKTDPAAQVTANWVKGDLADRATLLGFLRGCSVVTFESEFLDAELLGELAGESAVAIYPRPETMAVLQDRLTQKRLFEKNSLPSATYYPVASEYEAKRALVALGGAAVFKKRRFGYDGYGTFVVRSEAELEHFLPELTKNPSGFIAEKLIKFSSEIAVMAARNASGQTVLLPFVETFQENSRCLWCKGPLKQNAELKKISKKIVKFLNSIDYVGVIGFEMFTSKQGLLINEVAPRVHNSGHYSQDALSEDQFTLHLKSILDLKLNAPSLLAKGFAMMNLLGSSADAPAWNVDNGVKLHWYGKQENRPGRKMGHINALAGTPQKALALVKKRRADFCV